jgi:hypothetical protein
MRDTRVLYFHGEVSSIPLGSEGKVTADEAIICFRGGAQSHIPPRWYGPCIRVWWSGFWCPGVILSIEGPLCCCQLASCLREMYYC